MELDGVLADVELAGDLRVLETAGEQVEDLPLARGERLGELLDGWCGLLKQPFGQGFGEYDQALPRGGDRGGELLGRRVGRDDAPASELHGAQRGDRALIFGDQDERLGTVLGYGDGGLSEEVLVRQQDDVGLGERRRGGGRGSLPHHPHLHSLGVREHRTQPRPGHRRRSHDEGSRRRHAARPEVPKSTSKTEILPPRKRRRRTLSPARAMASRRDSGSSYLPSVPSSTSPTSIPAFSAGLPASRAVTIRPVSGTSEPRREAGSSTGSKRTPRRGRRRRSPASQALAALLGIESARRPKIMALMPTTSPRALRSGPPELPGARETSD